MKHSRFVVFKRGLIFLGFQRGWNVANCRTTPRKLLNARVIFALFGGRPQYLGAGWFSGNIQG
jgi:hypothetical protein